MKVFTKNLVLTFVAVLAAVAVHAQWKQVTSITQNPITFMGTRMWGAHDYLVVETGMGLYKTTDSGNSWGINSSVYNKLLLTVWQSDIISSGYYQVGNDIFSTIDIGHNLSDKPQGIGKLYDQLENLEVIDGVFFMRTHAGGLYVSYDSGVTNTRVTVRTIYDNVEHIEATGGKLYILKRNNPGPDSILVSSDYAATWQWAEHGLPNYALGDTLVMGITPGHVLKYSTDGGQTYNTNTCTNCSGHAVQGYSNILVSTTGIYVLNNGALYSSTDWGQSFTLRSDTVNASYIAMAFGKIWANSTEGMYYFNEATGKWALPAKNIAGLYISPDTWSVNNKQHVFHSMDKFYRASKDFSTYETLPGNWVFNDFYSDNTLFLDDESFLIYDRFDRILLNDAEDNVQVIVDSGNSAWNMEKMYKTSAGLVGFRTGSFDFLLSTDTGRTWVRTFRSDTSTYADGSPYGVLYVSLMDATVHNDTVYAMFSVDRHEGGIIAFSKTGDMLYKQRCVGIANFNNLGHLAITDTGIVIYKSGAVYIAPRDGRTLFQKVKDAPNPTTNYEIVYCKGLLINSNLMASPDEGRTWIPFNQGLMDNAANYRIGKLVVSDSMIYACGHNGGVWMRHVSDFDTVYNVEGVVYIDLNNNYAQGVNEPVYRDALIANGRSCDFTMHNSATGYKVLSLCDSTLLLLTNPPKYSYPVQPALMVGSGTKNIPVQMLPDVRDLSVNAVMAAGRNRPGGTVEIKVTVYNEGSVVQPNALVHVQIPPFATYNAASITPAQLTADSVTFNLGSMNVLDRRDITLTFTLATSLTTADTLNFDMAAYPVVNDSVPADNYYHLPMLIRNSFDPNEKEVNPAVATPAYVRHGGKLLYTIHFQNMGNIETEIVKVNDTISNRLQLHTIRMVSSSHPCTMNIHGRVLQFVFDPCYLLPLAENEAASKGYVSFEVLTDTTLQLGDSVENKAAIYFDYNGAIITNTAQSQVAVSSVVTATPNILPAVSLQLSPNPVTGMLTIQSDLLPEPGSSYTIRDINGRLVSGEHRQAGNKVMVNTSALPAGIYLVTVSGSGATISQRFVKQ